MKISCLAVLRKYCIDNSNTSIVLAIFKATNNNLYEVTQNDVYGLTKTFRKIFDILPWIKSKFNELPKLSSGKHAKIIIIFIKKYFTDVAKLVDALDLGPSNFCFESSSLSIRNFFYPKPSYIYNFLK